MNKTLWKREWRANYKVLLIFGAVLSLYSVMIICMFDPKLGESLKVMMESMPQIFSAFGMASPGITLLDFVINYLYGFLLVVFPVVFIIILVNRLMIRYTDRGIFAYLLATPNSRTKLTFTLAGVLCQMILILVIYVTFLTIAVAAVMFPGELEIGKFLLVNAGLLGLLFFLSGVCFLFSCIFSESGKAMGFGAGACILFILVQMLSQVGEKFDRLKYATPLTLFQPEKIAAGNREAVWMFLILYGAGFLLFGVGIRIFSKKDLSI